MQAQGGVEVSIGREFAWGMDEGTPYHRYTLELEKHDAIRGRKDRGHSTHAMGKGDVASTAAGR